MNIKVISKRTRKLDFAKGYTAFVGIVERHDPEELNIAGAFSKLGKGLALAEQLKIESRKLPLTQQQQKLYAKVDDAFAVIRHFAKNTRYRKDQADEAMLPLVEFFEGYLKNYLYKKSISRLSTAGIMLAEYNANETLQSLAEKSLLTELMAHLNTVYSELNQINEERRNKLTKLRRGETARIKHILYYNMRDMATAIKGASLKYQEIDYNPLIAELNLLAFDYEQKQKAANRKAADQPKTEPDAQSDDLHEAI